MEEKIYVNFEYIDECGLETQMSKYADHDYMGGEGQLDPLCYLFKDFLLACGFTYLHDKKIQWVHE